MPDFAHPTPHPDLVGHVLGMLEPPLEHEFEVHLAHCEACRQEAEELRGLPALVAAAAPAVEVPPGLRARTFAAIEAASQEDRGERLRKHARRLLAAAVAMLVLAAAGIAVTQARRAPEGSVIALVAADGGPQHGVARVRETSVGRVVDMEIDDLPPPPPGTHYACWFVGPGDSLQRPYRVSVGTFTMKAPGKVRLHMTSAASPVRFPLMGVTLEPDDGNPQRHGTKVLVTKPPT